MKLEKKQAFICHEGNSMVNNLKEEYLKDNISSRFIVKLYNLINNNNKDKLKCIIILADKNTESKIFHLLKLFLATHTYTTITNTTSDMKFSDNVEYNLIILNNNIINNYNAFVKKMLETPTTNFILYMSNEEALKIKKIVDKLYSTTILSAENNIKLTMTEIINYLYYISKEKKIKISRLSLIDLVKQADQNIEKCLDMLEKFNPDIDEIYNCNYDNEYFYKLLKEKKWSDIRLILMNKEINLLTILPDIERLAFLDNKISVKLKSEITEIIADNLFKLNSCNNKDIIIASIISKIMKLL